MPMYLRKNTRRITATMAINITRTQTTETIIATLKPIVR